MDDGAPFQGLDPREPSIARVYDAFLGGKDNYAADREVAARLTKISPEFVQGAHDNRAFIGRAVTWAAGRGIRQFLDLGSGLPTHPAVHEFAREAIPDARVCYVDNDPVAVLHAQALLAKPEGITVIKADLTDLDVVLAGSPSRARQTEARDSCGTSVLYSPTHRQRPAASRTAYPSISSPWRFRG